MGEMDEVCEQCKEEKWLVAPSGLVWSCPPICKNAVAFAEKKLAALRREKDAWDAKCMEYVRKYGVLPTKKRNKKRR